jgi:putative heme-binding domain-containing protein
LVEIGRGSPTGLVVYRHHAFPEKYRNGVFSLCWTFGRLYFFPLERDGSTYKSKMEVFMQTTGDIGFAPTDMAVGPDGDLFISIGGRGTRGGVFKVSYKGKRASRGGSNPQTVEDVLSADEPLSSWSRARWVPKAKELGKGAFADAMMNEKLSIEQRIRAVEILTELFGGIPIDLARKLCEHDGTEPELIARIVWSLSRTGETAEQWKIIMAVTKSKHPRSARAAWEAQLAMPDTMMAAWEDAAELKLSWKDGIESQDRRVRAAALELAKDRGRKAYITPKTKPPSNAFALASYWFDLSSGVFLAKPLDDLRGFFGFCVHVVDSEKKAPLRMEAVRLMQLSLGDVFIEEGPATKPFWGYEARYLGRVNASLRGETARKLEKVFPTGDELLDQELGRLLAMLGEDVPGLPKLVADRWTKGSTDSNDIHYLLVLGRLSGKRDEQVTKKTAAALNGIHVKLAAQGAKPADQVPGILEGLLERLIELDPNLPAAIVDDAAFGNPGHVLWANKLPLDQKRKATRKLLARIGTLNEEDAHLAWSPDLVRLVGTLPDEEALPLLRARFTDARLMDTVALRLTAKPQAEDRGRFVDALGSLQPSVIGAAAEALFTLPPAKEKPESEIGKAVRALRRLEGQKTDGKARSAVVKLLTHWTGKELKVGKEGPAAAWGEWFGKTYPNEAALTGPTGTDFKAWKKRLDAIDWDKGDVKRGEAVFQRRNCFACHSGSRRLGPELTGIGQRFSRDDLFTAIIDPSKDISPSFVATMIATTTGKVYNGMMVYESKQLYLLQTTPDTTVRISGEEVQSVQRSAISFMPAGLLDDAKDGDLADLYAYLTSLRKK